MQLMGGAGKSDTGSMDTVRAASSYWDNLPAAHTF